jgi:hypothetical protein
MSKRIHLTTWVSSEAKALFAAVARAQGLSESALLRRLVESSLVAVKGAASMAPEPPDPIVSSGRISVRLRSDDLLLLRERATARQMPTSSYVSFLARAHLRAQTPLPTAELMALKQSVAQVGAIGRNINQIARAVNEAQWPHGPNKADLLAVLRVLAALRDHFKALINANLTSWSTGHDKTSH